jgi:hypothetical protein
MVELRINGRKIDKDSALLFKDFMNGLTKELAKSSQVVSALKVNGQFIDEIKESNLAMFTLDQLGKIDITTADQIELAFEALHTARAYIRKIVPHSRRLAELYTRNQNEAAESDFLELVNALDNLTSLILSAQSVLRGRYRGIHTNDSSLRIAQVRLVSAIEELLPAKKSLDNRMLADVLGVELPEALIEMCDFGLPVLQRLRTS